MKQLSFIFILCCICTSIFSQNVLLEQQNTNIIYSYYDNVFTFGMDTCRLGELFFEPSIGIITKSNNQIQWNVKEHRGKALLTIGYIDNNADSVILNKRKFVVRRLPEMKIVVDRSVHADHFTGDLRTRLQRLKEVKAIIPTISDTFEIVHFNILIKYKDEVLPMMYSNWGSEVNKGIREILETSKAIDAIVLTNFSVEKNGKHAEYLHYYKPNGHLYFCRSKTKRGTYASFFRILEEDALFYSIFNTKLDCKLDSTCQVSIADTISIEVKSYHRNLNNYLEDSTIVVSTNTSKLYEISYFSNYALVKSYHQNGKLKQKGFIEQDCGRQELSDLSFNPQTFKEKMYYFQLLNKKGEWKTYNEKGELIYKRHYDCGELLREEKIYRR